jgi:hypothetical protein
MALPEDLKLDLLQVVSATHLRIADGCTTLLQMQGMLAKMAAAAEPHGRVVVPGVAAVAAPPAAAAR